MKLNRTLTDEFCDTMKTRKDMLGVFGRMVVMGYLPDGVNPRDPRIDLLHTICCMAPFVPACDTCNGSGIFSVRMNNDFCADCFGSGFKHPCDASFDYCDVRKELDELTKQRNQDN